MAKKVFLSNTTASQVPTKKQLSQIMDEQQLDYLIEILKAKSCVATDQTITALLLFFFTKPLDIVK